MIKRGYSNAEVKMEAEFSSIKKLKIIKILANDVN